MPLALSALGVASLGEVLVNAHPPCTPELGYYREMVTTQREALLPQDGYGVEPRTDADVLLLTLARIQPALPPGWTVEVMAPAGRRDGAAVRSREADALLSLVFGDRPVVTYEVEVRRVLKRGGALAIIDQLNAVNAVHDSGPSSGKVRRLVVSRYLSPQLQDLLRQRGIAYADATGNLFLSSSDPLILVADRGASADPWRGPGRPTTSLKGLPAALLVRALVDYAPPYTVPDLADIAGTSLGASYRLVDYLISEGLLARTERGPITSVDWPELLRRWAEQARYLDTSTTRRFLEPRGLDSLVAKLDDQPQSGRYAVSGSLAARPYASYAEARLALVYAEDPVVLAADLDLRPVETGANVILAAPRSPVVFERTTTWQGVTIVAPSQAAADLLGGPGRNPGEGEYLLDWMKENPDAWRRQLDR